MAIVLAVAPSYAQHETAPMNDDKSKPPVIDQSVTSHNQLGGITAHTVNIGPQPWRLDNAGKTAILAHIPKKKKVYLQIVGNKKMDEEAGVGVAQFMRANGYDVAVRAGDVIYPGPNVPLSWDLHPEHTKVWVAPSAH